MLFLHEYEMVSRQFKISTQAYFLILFLSDIIYNQRWASSLQFTVVIGKTVCRWRYLKEIRVKNGKASLFPLKESKNYPVLKKTSCCMFVCCDMPYFYLANESSNKMLFLNCTIIQTVSISNHPLLRSS